MFFLQILDAPNSSTDILKVFIFIAITQVCLSMKDIACDINNCYIHIHWDLHSSQNIFL